MKENDLEDRIKNLERRVSYLEDDLEEVQDPNKLGFYGIAELWLKYYPTDLDRFFPEGVNEISKYFEKVLNDKNKKGEEK